MENKKDYKPVQSIERIFQILEILAMNPQGLSLLTLSEKTGLPSSTVHRLLHTLYALGYTEWRGNNSSPYKLTLRLFEYGNHSLNDRPFIRSVISFLERLAKELTASVYLYIPDGNDILVAAKAGTYSTRNEPLPGERIPMYCCSAGKSILSLYSVEELIKTGESFNFIPFTPNTIQSLDELLAAREKDHKNGYSLSKEEYIVGLYSLSIPLINSDGSPFGALGITVSPQQFSSKPLMSWVAPLKQYAESIQTLYPGIL